MNLILKNILLSTALITGALAYSMEAPQAAQHIALHSLPKELQAIIASQAGDTLIKTCASIRSLACVNKFLHTFINNEEYALAIIDLLAHCFNKTRLEVALHLRTPAACAWMKRCFAEDTNNEFARTLHNKLSMSMMMFGRTFESPLSKKIIEKVLKEEEYSEQIIQDFKESCNTERSAQSTEKYRIADFLCKKFPSIISCNEPKVDYSSNTIDLEHALFSCNPDILALFLEMGVNLPENDDWNCDVNLKFRNRKNWLIGDAERYNYTLEQKAIQAKALYYEECEIREMIKSAYQKQSINKCKADLKQPTNQCVIQ